MTTELNMLTPGKTTYFLTDFDLSDRQVRALKTHPGHNRHNLFAVFFLLTVVPFLVVVTTHVQLSFDHASWVVPLSLWALLVAVTGGLVFTLVLAAVNYRAVETILEEVIHPQLVERTGSDVVGFSLSGAMSENVDVAVFYADPVDNLEWSAQHILRLA